METADIELTEIRVAEDAPEGFEGLFQDFFTVRNEKQSILAAGMLSAEIAIIERGDIGFAGAGCSDNEVSCFVAKFTFCRELVQDCLLIRVRTNEIIHDDMESTRIVGNERPPSG